MSVKCPYLQNLTGPLLGELAEGGVIDSECGVACDAEEGGVGLFGGGFPWEEVVEDHTVPVLCVRIHVDDRQTGTLAVKQV